MSAKLVFLVLAYLAIVSVALAGKSPAKHHDERCGEKDIERAAKSAIAHYSKTITEVGSSRGNWLISRIIAALRNFLTSLLNLLRRWINAIGHFPIWALVNLIISIILVIISLIIRWLSRSLTGGQAERDSADWYDYACRQVDNWAENYGKDGAEIAEDAKQILEDLSTAFINIIKENK